MKAIILAAGIGKRLAPFTNNNPKILIKIGEKTLLEYYIETLNKLGIKDIVIVIGHCQDMIKNKVKEKGFDNIKLIENKEYNKGAIISLYLARNEFSDDMIIMDADVIYDPLILKKLIDSKQKNCVLADKNFENTGEERKIFVKNGFVKFLEKKQNIEGFNDVGEGVGFTKISKEDGQLLKSILKDFINKGCVEYEHEDAFMKFMKKRDVGYEDITGLKWVEIDFKEDIKRAREIYKIIQKNIKLSVPRNIYK